MVFIGEQERSSWFRLGFPPLIPVFLDLWPRVCPALLALTLSLLVNFVWEGSVASGNIVFAHTSPLVLGTLSVPLVLFLIFGDVGCIGFSSRGDSVQGGER